MIRQEQCNKVCRILDDVLANRPTERDSLIVAVRKAFDALEQAETNCSEIPNNWIPCSERSPEERGLYLTTTKNKEVYCDYWNEDNFDRTEMVIAWMPLPEPYQEGR